MTVKLKRNDTKDTISYKITNLDGSVVNLTGASVKFVMGKGKTLITNAAAIIVNAATGEVSYTLTDSDTLVAGTFNAEFEVTFSDGKIKSYPSNGYILVNIQANVDSDKSTYLEDKIALRVSDIELFKTEVNTKVDQAAADAAKVNDFENRINNIVAQAGTDNTEIVDARLRNDGTVAPTVGSHLRELSTSVAQNMTKIQDIEINIEDFSGANDSEKLQNALNALPNGGTIRFSKDTYTFTTQCNYVKSTLGGTTNNGIKLKGKGARRTKLINNVPSGCFLNVDLSQGNTSSSFNFGYDFLFENIFLQGNSGIANSGGIKLRGCWNVEFNKAIIDSHTGKAIEITYDVAHNPDYTASGFINLKHTRLTSNEYGIHAVWGNATPFLHVQDSYVCFNKKCGIKTASSLITIENSAISGNGDNISGEGGIYQLDSGYDSKCVKIIGNELDTNYPYNLKISNTNSPIIERNNFIAYLKNGEIPQHSIVIGDSTSGKKVRNAIIDKNNFQLPNNLAGTGKIHTFVKILSDSDNAYFGKNSYGITGGTQGTDFKYVEDDGAGTKIEQQYIYNNSKGYSSINHVPVYYTVPDDGVISFKTPKSHGFVAVTMNGGDNYSAIYFYTSSQIKLLAKPDVGVAYAFKYEVSTLALTGTTGTDAKITVSCNGGNLYLENRDGSSRDFFFTFM